MVRYVTGLTLLFTTLAPVGFALSFGWWTVPLLPFFLITDLALFRFFRELCKKKNRPQAAHGHGGHAARSGQLFSETNCRSIIPRASENVKREGRSLTEL